MFCDKYTKRISTLKECFAISTLKECFAINTLKECFACTLKSVLR